MRKHFLSSLVLQSSLIWANFIVSIMFATLDKRMDLGEPDWTRGSGGSTIHQSNWPQELGLTLCTGSVQRPCIALTHPQNLQNPVGLRSELPSLYVFSHMLMISGGLSQLLFCHLDCKEMKRENQEKGHALTDISGIQNSWLHCILTIVLLNVNHSVYYSYYSFTSYNLIQACWSLSTDFTGVGSLPQCYISWVLSYPVVRFCFTNLEQKYRKHILNIKLVFFTFFNFTFFSTNGVDWFDDNKEMYPQNDPIV